MPIVPIRDLGSIGVNTDIDPYILPPQAFNVGINARFENKLISRGPISKLAATLVANVLPRFAIGYSQLTGTTKFFICNSDGTVIDWSVSGFTGIASETNVSPGGYVPSTSSNPFTSTTINDIVYLNRPDRVPWFVSKSTGTAFATLPVWDPTWRCAAFRSVAGVLVAINVTKGATSYPTMVKTSDYTTFGATPGAWVASPSNAATENVISDLKEPLIDGYPLRERMILYAAYETWVMQPTLDTFVFSYYKLFTNAGAISQNCVVERNNIHYVFGSDDIWMHDGFQRKSLASGIVRNFIFQNVVRAQIKQCFVAHNPRLNEIMFCYPSTDANCTFALGGTVGYPGCNRAAVYNYLSGVWYFYDLPYVTYATLGTAISGAVWSDMAATYWNSFDSTWATLTDVAPFTTLALGVGVTTPRGILKPAVRTFDVPNSPYALGTIDTVATPPVYLESQGMGMDHLGAHIGQYRVIKSIWPEARFDAGANPLMFNMGSVDYAGSAPPVYGVAFSYDGLAKYKLDFMSPGRFLSVKITFDDTKNFILSGFDIDFNVTGSR